MEEKKWILSKEEEHSLTGRNDSLESTHPMGEPKPDKERPTNLFQQKFSRRKQDVTAIPPTSLDDTIMSLNESYKIINDVHVFYLSLITNISNTNIPSNSILTPTTLDPLIGDQGRRYPSSNFYTA